MRKHAFYFQSAPENMSQNAAPGGIKIIQQPPLEVHLDAFRFSVSCRFQHPRRELVIFRRETKAVIDEALQVENPPLSLHQVFDPPAVTRHMIEQIQPVRNGQGIGKEALA
jgi:hypothetical protein